jgi:hypothetical protein
MKKILLFLGFTLLLTSCGVPDEVKLEAEQYKEAYSQDFIDKVHEVYGDEVEVKDIEGVIRASGNSVVPIPNYVATGDLSCTIVIDAKKYSAIYYPYDNYIVDNVHTETIEQQILESIPINTGDIAFNELVNSKQDEPLFESTLTDLNKVLSDNSDHCDAVTLRIITKEDLSKFNEKIFKDNNDFKKLISGKLSLRIQIVSIKKLWNLEKGLNTLHFDDAGRHPRVYNSDGADYADAFDYYNIKNTIEIRCGYEKFNYVYTE